MLIHGQTKLSSTKHWFNSVFSAENVAHLFPRSKVMEMLWNKPYCWEVAYGFRWKKATETEKSAKGTPFSSIIETIYSSIIKVFWKQLKSF